MDKLEKIPFYKKGLPHKPIYGTDFLDDLKANWGEEWGIKSPFGKIRKIMVSGLERNRKTASFPKTINFSIYPKGLLI